MMWRFPGWRWRSCARALAILLALAAPTVAQEPERSETVWYTADEEGAVGLNVHFFRALGCPYCKKEQAFLDILKAKYSWLHVTDYEVSKVRENITLMLRMAKDAGGSTSLVPTIFICNQMTVGFTSAETTGEVLHRQMVDCYKRVLARGGENALREVAARDVTEADIAPIDLPLIGLFDPGSVSLPVLTVAIATVDSFNPCGLFVLLMLMSMMIRARSRAHMVVIGASFGATWATMYFLLMTAWLSLFEVVGDVTLITTVAGVIVLLMAAVNFKDYLGIKRGPSLSISEKKKAGLFARMGQLARQAAQWTKGEAAGSAGHGGAVGYLRQFAPMVVGTVLLTLSAGGYAILCTTGFAMTYTRVLTLHDLPTLSYVLYLFLYVSVYMVPMTLIVVVFTITLGSRRLKESEGRALKLLAAIMLGTLGVILITAPDLLKNPLIVVGVMMVAFVITVIVVNAENMIRRPPEAGRESAPDVA